MKRQLAAKLCLPNPEMFVVHYFGTTQIAACLTQEREAYDLAEQLHGLVTHVPLFKTAKAALEDSNLAYEADRITSEQPLSKA